MIKRPHNILSECLYRIKLELEYRNLIFDFKDDLTIIKHCKLQSTLGVCRANLFKYIRANRVVKFNFRVTFVLLILINLRCCMFYFFNWTASRYISFNGNKFKFLLIAFLYHMSGNADSLRVFLDFCNKLT